MTDPRIPPSASPLVRLRALITQGSVWNSLILQRDVYLAEDVDAVIAALQEEIAQLKIAIGQPAWETSAAASLAAAHREDSELVDRIDAEREAAEAAIAALRGLVNEWRRDAGEAFGLGRCADQLAALLADDGGPAYEDDDPSTVPAGTGDTWGPPLRRPIKDATTPDVPAKDPPRIP